VEEMMRVQTAVPFALMLMCLVAIPSFAQEPALAAAVNGPRSEGPELPDVRFDAPVPSPSFGTSSYEVLSLYSYGFEPLRQPGEVTGVDEDGNGYTWATGGTNMLFISSLTIPAGAVIDYIGLNYCDGTDSSAFTVRAFDMYGTGPTQIGAMVNLPNNASCGWAYNATAFNYQTTQNSGRFLALYVWQTGPAVTGLVKFQGAEVRFKRTVSPGPASATFGDVPTTSPYFKFIEALSAAGIVAGCGGGNYCPAAAVTRGQMAVYLAVALGLHYPN
jgi:hypothetical protein